MKEKLDLIEGRLQSLIEGSISLLLPRNNRKQSLAHELVEAMHSHLSVQPDGQIYAPSLYIIHINPASVQSWFTDASVLREIARVLEQAARDAGFLFSSEPGLQVMSDDNLQRDELQIETTSHGPKLGQTTNISLQPGSPNGSEERDIMLLHAFLIVNSETNFHLGSTVINIGRRKDNHLVIDDLRVSRVHAQLRPARGHYILFDLNSKGGTFVNNHRISKQTLNPGDVISLAGVPIIYGEDTSRNPSHNTGYTQKSQLDLRADTSTKPDQDSAKRRAP